MRDIRQSPHLQLQSSSFSGHLVPCTDSQSQDELLRILELLKTEFKNDWLLTLEICELTYIDADVDGRKIYKLAHDHLMSLKKVHPKYQKLISDGLTSIDNVLYK